jgi:hypothetical protein
MNFSTVTSLSILLLMIGSFSTESEAQSESGSQKICKWFGNQLGLYCDGPDKKIIWSILNCNDFCVKRNRRSGGQCLAGNNYDRSPWCPPRQVCRCF